MKRITTQESQKYISLEEDFTNKTLQDCPYFTLTPSSRGAGWDTITYYTARRKDTYSDRGTGDQWVYVLSNPTTPNLLKIGYTKNTPDERAKQISAATGVALPYKVEFAFKCFNGEQLEGEVHRFLSEFRVNNQREFFEVSLEEATKAIEELGVRYL
jgi:hypothetical protein